jgi:microcystin-dependent protein
MPLLKYYDITTSQWLPILAGAKGDTGDIGPQGIQGNPGEALPAGSIVQWGSNTIPTNWLLCDGSAVSRSTYSSLFAAIGTSYGIGDNSTTFNLPDLRGRVAVGRDSTQTEFDVLGETGGAKTHTLTIPEMPSHTHTQNAHSHGLGFTVAANQTSFGDRALALSNTSFGLAQSVASTTATNQNTGGGGAHNNLQPYQVFNYIIKATAGTTAGDSELATRLGVAEGEIDVLQARDLSGMVLVKTQTIGTAVSTVTVNDAFSANYDNYKIIVSDGVGSAEQILGLRLGAVTTAYFGALVYSTYTTATPVAATNNNNAGWTWAGFGSTVSQSINAEISSPFLAKRTFISTGLSLASTTQWAGTFNGFQNSNTSFTGFTIFTNTGTMTGGTIYVYGYKK